MNYTDALYREIKPTLSNIFGFAYPYVLFYLILNTTIDATIIVTILGICIGSLFFNSYLAYSGMISMKRIPSFWPNKKIAFKKALKKDIRLTIQTLFFFEIYLLISYLYQIKLPPTSLIALLTTGTIFSFFIKSLFKYK